MKKFLKRSTTIQLSSKSLDNIFYCLTKNATIEEVKENFLFEVNMNEECLNYKIIVPLHEKYLRFKNDFKDFNELYIYMKMNSKDKFLIPFLGVDKISKNNI